MHLAVDFFCAAPVMQWVGFFYMLCNHTWLHLNVSNSRDSDKVTCTTGCELCPIAKAWWANFYWPLEVFGQALTLWTFCFNIQRFAEIAICISHSLCLPTPCLLCLHTSFPNTVSFFSSIFLCLFLCLFSPSPFLVWIPLFTFSIKKPHPYPYPDSIKLFRSNPPLRIPNVRNETKQQKREAKLMINASF